MAKEISYVVITPVRNEANNFPKTIESFLKQTVRPTAWVVVDDGSTDGTAEMVDQAAANHSWIQVVHRKDRGFRQPGTGVIQAFYEGYEKLAVKDWDFLVKFDGDLAFGPDYFERCFRKFEDNPKIGIGGGLVCKEVNGELVAEVMYDPAFHVRGATKTYRRQCWDQIGGLMKAPGWDTIDELKANMLGWQTGTFKDLKVHQLKTTGSADGSSTNWVKNGLANYITGYSPIFMALKCAGRLNKRPYLLQSAWLGWGFISGYLKGVQQVADRELIRYVRNQQWRKLTRRSNIWG